MMCDTCAFADMVGGYPEGEPMFDCCCKDPRVPFHMDEDVVCPCYRKAEK